MEITQQRPFRAVRLYAGIAATALFVHFFIRELSPDFQRKDGIWSDEAQSRLIESLLIGIPLPTFYMDATDEDKWLVIDGLQRLTTLKRFVIMDKFMELMDQRKFKNAISQGTGHPNKVKVRFEGINRIIQEVIS